MKTIVSPTATSGIEFAADTVTEYAVRYREHGDRDDTIEPVGDQTLADEFIRELDVHRGITAVTVTREVTTWQRQPRPGDTVRYHGRRQAKHGVYTVHRVCVCLGCRYAERTNRLDLITPGGRGIGCVHPTEVEVIDDELVAS